jgi:competence protein ComEC
MSSAGFVPCVRITLPFATGIWIYERCGFVPPEWWLYGVTIGLFVLISLLIFKILPMPSYSLRWMGGLLFVLIFVCAGYLRFADYDRYDLPVRDRNTTPGSETYGRFLVVLEEAPVRKSRSYGALARAMAMEDTARRVCLSADVLLMSYFAPDSLVDDLQKGDTLLFEGTFRANAPPANPESFDYGRYLRRKGIHGTIYLPASAWKLKAKGCQKGVFARAEHIRKSIRCKISGSALSEQNKGLALALLIGIKDDLDPETSRSFAAAGAVHVLCVSGLHVGIVYMMVSLLFGFLKHIKRYGRLLFFLCGVVSIWGYALVTGLPPSVNRASLMFSFMMTGNLLRRKTPSINGVLASAFVLLMDEPPVIFHAGFQLSYLAVIGIITLHPVVSQLWAPRWKLMVKIRDLISVSLCAQLFTFPVAVSMFSIFPNYFLLTNLLVIPITGMVVYAGVVFLVVPYAALTGTTTWVFNTLLTVMRWMVDFVDGIPGALTENILLSGNAVWLLLITFFTLMMFLKGEGKRWLYGALMAGMLTSVDGFVNAHQGRNQSQVVLYQVRKAMVTDLISNGSRISVLSSDTLPEKDLSFAVSGWRLKMGVADPGTAASELVLGDASVIKVIHPKGAILFLNGLPVMHEGPVMATAAVIGPGLKPSEELIRRVDAEVWILDERMPAWKRNSWRDILEINGQKYWDINQLGAWKI